MTNTGRELLRSIGWHDEAGDEEIDRQQEETLRRYINVLELHGYVVVPPHRGDIETIPSLEIKTSDL